jgi:hypothetical protein
MLDKQHIRSKKKQARCKEEEELTARKIEGYRIRQSSTHFISRSQPGE